MEDLLEAAADIWQGVDQSDDLRLIGGLAVHLWVGEASRTTRDIDIVALDSGALELVLNHMRSKGHSVGESAGWWRAISAEGSRIIIDVSGHPIVNPRTFDAMQLLAPPRVFRAANTNVLVAGVDDLIRLKLVAGRDQDLVDLLLLCTRCETSSRNIARAAELDDIERAVSAGAHRARHALETGVISSAMDELLERSPEKSEIEALGALLRLLAEEGL